MGVGLTAVSRQVFTKPANTCPVNELSVSTPRSPSGKFQRQRRDIPCDEGRSRNHRSEEAGGGPARGTARTKIGDQNDRRSVHVKGRLLSPIPTSGRPSSASAPVGSKPLLQMAWTAESQEKPASHGVPQADAVHALAGPHHFRFRYSAEVFQIPGKHCCLAGERDRGDLQIHCADSDA